MHTVTGARLRLLLATVAGTLLLLGATANAGASTYTDLAAAQPGEELTVSPGVTLVPGSVSSEGSTTTLSGSSIDFGGGFAGSNVTATLSDDELTLAGGEFDVPDTLTKQSLTTDPADPFTFGFTDGEVTSTEGEFVSSASASAPSIGTFAAGDVTEDDLASALPPIRDNFRFRLSYRADDPFTGPGCIRLNPFQTRCPQQSPLENSWSFGVILSRTGAPDREVIGGRVYGQVVNGVGPYSYEIDVAYPLLIDGREVMVNGRLTGDNLFQPSTISGLSGSITGEIELTKGVFFTGGSVSWDADGFKLSGSARVECAEGAVQGQLAGEFVDDENWSLKLSGGATGGCTISEDLKLPTGSLIGEIESVDGDVTGLFEVRGDIETTLLPAGVNVWDAGFRFIYDGTDAGSRIEFLASAGIGTAQGVIRFDGTLALNANFTIPLGNSTVAFDGDIKRETPGGPVVYDVGGSANIAVNSNASVAGSVRLTNTQLALSGSATLACPVSGSITGGVSANIPLTSTRTWALGISGGAGANGCRITNEFALGAGTGLTGEVRSVSGVVSVAANANANINTTLVPTKTSFAAGFAFAASQGAYSVAVNGSTQGAGFSAAVASNGTFDLSFNLSDLALGGVSLGANGTIKRTTPGGAVAYSISGSLAGEAKIYENLFLRSGSLSISSTGGLSFSGSVRQKCTTGDLIANASGQITDSGNWSFNANGIASGCTIGRAATFNGNTFNAKIDSVDGKVAYNAGLSVSRINLFSTRFLLIGQTTTWLTNVSGSLSNTCAGCQADGRIRLTFRGTGNAQFKLLILPTTVSATVDGSVDLRGTSVRRVDIRITKIGWNFLTFGVQAALVGALEHDVEKGFTTA